MTQDLPVPSRKRLRPAPLQLVVCQIRHEAQSTADPSAWFDVHRQLVDEYPFIEPHVQHDLTVSMSPTGVQTSGEPQSGFKLRSQDGLWNVALLPEFFALECTGYTRWSDFRVRLAKLIDAVSKSVAPRLEQRLGIRFIDKLEDVGVNTPADWAKNLDPNIAAALSHPTFGGRIVASESALQIRDGRYEIMLRHGAQEENSKSIYVIDTDCARVGGRIFDSELIAADIDELHTLSLQVFQACLSRDYLKSLETDEETP